MTDAPPDRTVEMNALEQTAAIRLLEDRVETLEQAIMLIVRAAGTFGELRDMIGDSKE